MNTYETTRRAELYRESSANGTATWSILFGFAFLTLPMLISTTILLGLVYHYRVLPGHNASDVLEAVSDNASGNDYFVNLSSTLLIFLSSVSSSLAPMLSGVAMFIFAFPLSARILRDTREDLAAKLMTPKQLALTLRFISGGAYLSLWKWLGYRTKKNNRSSSSLAMSAAVVLVTLALALIVFAADTWLHITTKTVELVLSSPLAQDMNYSLALQQNCSSSTPDNYIDCSMHVPQDSTPFLLYGNISTQVVNNVSNSMAVYNTGENNEFAYLGIADASRSPNHDYTATTYASKTQCVPVSRQCDLTMDSVASETFSCSSIWNSNSSQWNPGLASTLTMSFTNSSMLQASQGNSPPVENPFYYSLAAIFQPFSQWSDATWMMTDPELEEAGDGYYAMIVLCNTTMYDAQYDMVNGSITKFDPKQSNQTVANLFQSPIGWQAFDVEPYLKPAISLAVGNSGSAQELADGMAAAFNKLYVGAGASFMSSAPALDVRARETMLVTRLPQAPFFCLIAANLLFVALGIVLTAYALVNGSGAEANEVASRLSVDWLVAERFQNQQAQSFVSSVDDLLDESKTSGRVGIDVTSAGGYAYKEIQDTESTELLQGIGNRGKPPNW